MENHPDLLQSGYLWAGFVFVICVLIIIVEDIIHRNEKKRK